MPIANILFVLCAIAALSLLLVSFFNERERRQKIRQQRLHKLRQQTQDQEELVLIVDQLVESRAIARLINDEVISLIQEMIRTAPRATYLEASYQTALARGDALSDESSASPLDRLKQSDSQIAKSQRSLEVAATIIRRQQSNQRISFEEMNTFISELNWAHLMVAVVSHVGQGHKAMSRGDGLSAQAFYKKAQQLLVQSSHPDPRRQRMIKELSELLGKKRSSLSEDLMPETHLNPELKSQPLSSPEAQSVA